MFERSTDHLEIQDTKNIVNVSLFQNVWGIKSLGYQTLVGQRLDFFDAASQDTRPYAQKTI